MTPTAPRLPRCSPDCGTYRLEMERSSDVVTWTKAEAVAEIRKLRADLEKSELRNLSFQRQTRMAQRERDEVPGWLRGLVRVVRWVFKRGESR